MRTVSWRPAQEIREWLAKADRKTRQQLLRAMVDLAMEHNWGVDPIGNGDFWFRYYDDLEHIADLSKGVPEWILSIKPSATAKKEAFAAVWKHAQGKLFIVCPFSFALFTLIVCCSLRCALLFV